VLGDIIFLSAGDMIPADVRLIAVDYRYCDGGWNVSAIFADRT